MAGENVNPLDNSFGVEGTMEIGGAGDTKLLEDFLSSPETSADPDKLKGIIDEPKEPLAGKEEPKDPKKPENPEDPKEPEKPVSGQDIVSSFLDGKGGEEEEEETKPSKEEPKDKEGGNVPPEEPEEDMNQIAALAKDLYKLGVFTEVEGEPEVTTPESFLEKFNDEKRRSANEMIENFLGQFGEDRRRAFDAIFVNGVDPKEYFTAYNEIVDLANLDLKVEGNQEKVIAQALSAQGYNSEEIKDEVDRLKNYGDLESVAARHHKALVRNQASNLQRKEQEAQQLNQQKAAVREQYIMGVRSILEEKVKAKEFDGIPVNAKLANELQDFLLVDKWRTEGGETLTDFDRTILELKKPENHAMKVKIALLIKTLEKDPTLSTIQRLGTTKKSDQIFEELARQKTKTNVKGQHQQQNKTNYFQSL